MTLCMYRIKIEAIRGHTGRAPRLSINLQESHLKAIAQAGTSLETMLLKRFRELLEQQMAEIRQDRKRTRAEEDQRDTACRRAQNRERPAQDMWPEETTQGRQERERERADGYPDA